MANRCKCCRLRPSKENDYCSACVDEHLVMLTSVAKKLAKNANYPLFPDAAILSAGIVLRNLTNDEAAARDLLFREINTLETELEIATERNQTLAKDYVDMQSYARFLEKKYSHTVDIDAYKKQREPETLENNSGNS